MELAKKTRAQESRQKEGKGLFPEQVRQRGDSVKKATICWSGNSPLKREWVAASRVIVEKTV
jgi:hypothetical protein